MISVLSEDPALQREKAAALGKPTDALADEINELAADMLGDIIIDDGDSGYCIIEDYRELVEAMLK